MGFLELFGKHKKESEQERVEALKQTAQDTFTLDPSEEQPQTPVQNSYRPSTLPGPHFNRDPYTGIPQQLEQPPIIPLQSQSLEHSNASQQQKNMELVLSKLDAINAKLENLNKRMEIIERIAEQEQTQDNDINYS